MTALDAILNEKIAILTAKEQKRTIFPTLREDGIMIERLGKRLVSFSCNDYYGLTHHPKVIEAACEATKQYGAGAGASRLVSGSHPLYAELEANLARIKGAEAAMVFGSGYLANLGTIPTLVGKNDLILADKYIHACMLDAAKLSGATVLRFAHNNTEHCRMLLEAHRAEHQNCLILTETVFSMDGDRAPMGELKAIAVEYKAWLMSDDAHGLYVIEQPARAEIQMGTLSKALGSYGGYICGSRTLMDYLQTSARSAIYSTALPPASIAAANAAIEVLENDVEFQRKPFANATYFTQLLGIKPAESAVVPVIVEESKKALAASECLAEQGFYVAAIRPPTVPENTARLRFAFSAHHTREQIEAVTTLLLTQGFVCAS